MDIFRNWRVLDPENFHRVQALHWKKLPCWVFAPLAVASAGSIALVWYLPVGSPGWAIWANLLCQIASHVFTALTWGPWQVRLSRNPAGGQGRYLVQISRTQRIRTLLISGYAAILLAWSIDVLR